MSGKYIPDFKPYYDPSAEDKARKSEQLSSTIENMENEIRNKNLQGPVFTEENYKKKTRIQNYPNLNRESTNEFIANSYYYEAKGKESKICFWFFLYL